MIYPRDILSEYLAIPPMDDSAEILKARLRVLSALHTYLSVNISECGSDLERMTQNHLDVLFSKTIQSFDKQNKAEKKYALLSSLFELAFQTVTYPDIEKENRCFEMTDTLFKDTLSSAQENDIYAPSGDMMICVAHYLLWAGDDNATISGFYEDVLRHWRSSLASDGRWPDISDAEAWKRIAVLAADNTLSYSAEPQTLSERIVKAYLHSLPHDIKSRQDLNTFVAFTDTTRTMPFREINPEACEALVLGLQRKLPSGTTDWQVRSCFMVHTILYALSQSQEVMEANVL